jgi:hypothetical protein
MVPSQNRDFGTLQGFSVYSTESGAEAIEIARTNPLELLVLDLWPT